MSDRIRCYVENLRVPQENRETVKDLIYKLFERRHHKYVAGREQDWLTVELVQSLRRMSSVYRDELSTKTAGPLPFAIGYFSLQGGDLTLTTDQVPANVAPQVLVRFLSEFVEPGARLWFLVDGDVQGWEIVGEDNLEPLDETPPQMDNAFDESSSSTP